MAEMIRFKDRTHAGALLAQRLAAYNSDPNAIVLALPRGGVPVGYVIAEELHLPLDVFMVGKLGVPGQSEYAMGAVALNGHHVIQSYIVNELDIPSVVIHDMIQRKLNLLEQREKLYRANHSELCVAGRVVILVDDGLATGLTMLVAIQALRQMNPSRIVVAIPVAAHDSIKRIESEADELVCISAPERFYSVNLWYDNFKQVSDNEIIPLLNKFASPMPLEVMNSRQPGRSHFPTLFAGDG